MKPARVLLVCLLILGVPLQGFATVQYVDASCPMMQAASMDGMEGMSAHELADMMDAMGCHTDHDGAPKSGKPCPAGTSCQSVGAALLGAFRVPEFLSISQPVTPSVLPRFRSHDPPVLWRPPALI